MKSRRAAWQEEEDTRKDFSIVLILQESEILYLRALQGHSGRNIIDPTLQDNVTIPDVFFKYICHVGCAINLHSINQFRIDTGRSKFEQQTDISACGSHGQRTQGF